MLGNARYKLGKPNIKQVNLVESSLVRYTQFIDFISKFYLVKKNQVKLGKNQVMLGNARDKLGKPS